MRVLWFVALVIIATLVISLPGPAAEVVGVVFRQCLTIVSMADPGEAPTGYANVWLDSTSAKLTCESATGADCMPRSVGAVSFTISGGGSAVTTGLKACSVVEMSGTITQATTIADQSGSIVVDLWKDTYANYIPTDADSITASAPPTLSSAISAKDSTLTGWTKTVAAGDIICANVDSATTVTWAQVSLKITRGAD